MKGSTILIIVLIIFIVIPLILFLIYKKGMKFGGTANANTPVLNNDQQALIADLLERRSQWQSKIDQLQYNIDNAFVPNPNDILDLETAKQQLIIINNQLAQYGL